MRTLTEAFAPGAPSLPEGLRTLSVSPERTVEPGATIRATFAFANLGGAPATGARVRFALPEGMRYLAGSAKVDDVAVPDIRGETPLLAAAGAEIGEVPPGVERRISLALVAAPTIENGAVMALQAALSANETGVIGSNVVRLAARSAPVLTTPETHVAIEPVREPEPGEEVRISARVHNGGQSSARDVVVVVPVPDRTRFVAGSVRVDGRELAGEERSGDPFGYGIAPVVAPVLAAGATIVVEYRARIDSPLDNGTKLIASAAVASRETAEFEVPRAELTVRSSARFDGGGTRLVVDAPGEVEPGRRIRIAIAARNEGTCAADDVRARISLPEGLRYATGSRAIDGRAVAEPDAAFTFAFPRVDAGRTVEAAIDAYVVSPAVDGTALAIGGELHWASGSRSFDRTLVVRSAPRFAPERNVVVLDGPSTIAPGGEVRALVRVVNDGTAIADDVRLTIAADDVLQALRYETGTTQARVQNGEVELGALVPGDVRDVVVLATVVSPVADRTPARLSFGLRAHSANPVALGDVEAIVRSRPRFGGAASTLQYGGEALRPSAAGDVHVVLLNEGTDVAHDVRVMLDVGSDARIEAVDGVTRSGDALLFGDVAAGMRAEAVVRLRLARLVPRGTTVTVHARLESAGLLPFALAPLTIPTLAEPSFAGGATLRVVPNDAVDAGESLVVQLVARNGGDGSASKLVVRGRPPQHTTYLPGSTSINDVPLLDAGGGSVLWSSTGLVLEDVDPGVELVVRYRAVVATPLAAGTLIDAQADLTWDGGMQLALIAPPVRVRSTPSFAVRATGLPFSVAGVAPRTSDILTDLRERDRERARPMGIVPPRAALPPAGPPALREPDAIDARFAPAPPLVDVAPPPEAAREAPALTTPPSAPAPQSAAESPFAPEPQDEPEPGPGPAAFVPEPPAPIEPARETDTESCAPADRDEGAQAVPRPAPEVPATLRLGFTRDGAERAAAFLDQSDYGGLVTHLFAILTFVPTHSSSAVLDARLGTLRDALRTVVNRLFIKMRMPRYALTGKDIEDRAVRSALIDTLGAIASHELDPAPPIDLVIRVEGDPDRDRLLAVHERLESEPLGSAAPWIALASLIGTAIVSDTGRDERLGIYRAQLLTTLERVAPLPLEELHRVLAGTRDAVLDAALADVRRAVREALEAAAVGA